MLSLDTTQASAGSGVANSASVLTSYGSTIYMTSDALYVATNEYHYDQGSSSSNTRIDRFNISGTDIQWQASGRVPGTLLNQFALDEQHGDLHVATHTWASQWINNDPAAEEIDWSNGAWSIQNDNGVFVLDTEGDTLDQLGSVTGIAPGEQQYAVRFIGDTAYLVTFLRTDPLFAIDLSDPTNPTVLGELVIPGFSNYLQSVGDGLLLGIGQEREAGTWNTRLHASLFSVSDGTNLTQIARQFLDESAQWSSSQSQYDHHALLYSAEDGLLVLPVFGSGYDKESDTYHYEQLLEVLRVDASGIQLLGEIHSDQGVFRTVRIDNVLYAISDSSVTAYSLDDFSVVGQADLFVSWPWYEPVEVVFRNDAGSGGVVNTLGGVETPNPQIIVAIPSVSMIIAMSSAPSGSGTGSVTILAMAAQYAQNLANDYARATTPNLMSNTGLTPIGQNSRPIELPNLAAEDSSSSDRNESTEASTKASNESDGPSFDEFWNEFTKRLRNGNDPTPMEDADAPKAETPMSADKAASKTEAPNSRSATERQQPTGNAPEMSQRSRPVQRGSIPVVTVKAVTKTSAVKSSMSARPAR